MIHTNRVAGVKTVCVLSCSSHQFSVSRFSCSLSDSHDVSGQLFCPTTPPGKSVTAWDIISQRAKRMQAHAHKHTQSHTNHLTRLYKTLDPWKPFQLCSGCAACACERCVFITFLIKVLMLKWQKPGLGSNKVVKRKKKLEKLASLSQYLPPLVHLLTLSLFGFHHRKRVLVDKEHVVVVQFYIYLYSVSLPPGSKLVGEPFSICATRDFSCSVIWDNGTFRG